MNAMDECLSHGAGSLISRIHGFRSGAVEARGALLTITPSDVFGEFVLPVPTF